MTVPPMGTVVLVRNPADARLRTGGKRYRIEADGPHVVAFRDEGGTVCFRYLRAEVSRKVAAGRVVPVSE